MSHICLFFYVPAVFQCISAAQLSAEVSKVRTERKGYFGSIDVQVTEMKEQKSRLENESLCQYSWQ